jgi:hypothetical protein
MAPPARCASSPPASSCGGRGEIVGSWQLAVLASSLLLAPHRGVRLRLGPGLRAFPEPSLVGHRVSADRSI